MSDFLMVVPEGWSEVDGDIDVLIVDFGGEAAFLDAAQQGLAAVDSLIEPLGLPPDGMVVTDYRLFRDGGVSRLWVRYGHSGN